MKKFVRFALRQMATLGVIALSLAVLFLFRGPICRAAGKWWAVNDRVDSADAVVLLGGGLDWRPQAVARIFHEGRARTILVPRMEETQIVELGLQISDTQLTLALLEKLGVPSNAIICYGQNIGSTRDEAEGVSKWCREHSIHSIIIPTDYFPSRRARWVFEHYLAGSGVAVHVESVPLKTYDLDNWWQQEDGMVTFPIEVLKMVFYRLHYS